MALEDVTVALDWTPNSNHVGFYVAQARGMYADVGLSVKFISPHCDNYKATPALRVSAKEATLGLGPSETLFSYHSESEKPDLIAIATLLQQDLSSIATLKKSGINRPQELDGKRYASYGARYEGRIVQKMIQNDGGKGDYEEIVPAKLGIWSTLLEGKADATWVFSGWEGCAASIAGVELNEFRLSDYGIPYGYSPVLFCHPDTINSDSADKLSNFLLATAKGYAWAARQSCLEATKLFLKQVKQEHPDLLEEAVAQELVSESLNYMKNSFLASDGHWGHMDAAVWEAFLNWLQTEGLLTTYTQSRNPVPGVSVSLDELRQGNVGDPIAHDQINLKNVYTNRFLELARQKS
ncbi:uncharacterized protein [Physcomitrium patens]|uniref:Thiamine pyrimidine synthase n=1 Tax=Physcomitrium patens TaxID=3218 RepID=A0A7I4FJA3_PHYPA|nr:uncharacterized protein LOC112278280 isoform X1 [Physcomitrium patens]|eukprot:XP_024367298.1 uncharacterized protein LOC112278280 isoform X1 [Physcomitrella patens]